MKRMYRDDIDKLDRERLPTRHKCQFCPKSFQSKKDLEKHLKKIHGLTIATLKKLSDEGKTEFMEQCVGILDEIDKSSMETLGKRSE